MPNLFDGKTRPQIARAMAHLVSKEETETQFTALAALDAETRDYVVNSLEKDVLDLAGKFRQMSEDMGIAAAKKKFTDINAPDTAAAIREEQALTELVRQLVKLKGDAANPLLKAIGEEISKIPATPAPKENVVYGAMFDALEKTMQADGSLATLDDKLRLQKLSDAFGWRVTVGVKEHFTNTGKIKAFAAAPTEDEKAEQKTAMRGLLFKSDAEAAVATLTATDVFMRVARRVGTDEELAGLLPAAKFDEKDVEVLEKNKLDSLAALVKKAIGNQPK
jgi:hypothetical protein